MYNNINLVNSMSIIKNKAFVTGLFNRYEIRIRNFLMLKKHQKEDVEDIVQETFLKAHKVTDWKNVENPEAYLISIAKNAYNDHIRKEIRNVTHVDADISKVAVKDDMPSPEQTIVGRQELNDLERIVNKLTPRVKQAIIYVKFLELSYTEAAELMNVSKSTLKNHITIGMTECRKQMNNPATHVITKEDNKIISFSDHNSLERKNSSRILE